jgi:hypothetical protein
MLAEQDLGFTEAKLITEIPKNLIFRIKANFSKP